MLQTIYETESCFSSASADSHHQPLELLSGNRGSSTAMPTAGESSSGDAGGEEGGGAVCWRPDGAQGWGSGCEKFSP